MADKITRDRNGDNEFEDIDISMPQFDDIRLDAPLDGGGTDKGRGRKPDTPAKKIAVSGLKQLGKGVGNAFKNELYKEVPALQAINSEVQSTYTEFKGLKDELSGQLGPMLITLEDATRKVLPKAEKLLPKGIYDKLTKKLDERARERAADASTTQTKAQMEGQVIQDELAAIFSAEQTARRDDALEAKKQELTKMALDSTRHKQRNIQLTHLYDAVRSTELFHRTVHTAYLKKSLELKYKHLFVARDTFNLLSKSMATFEGYYKGILRNTSLPDMMKVKIGDYHRKNITDKYGTMMSDFMGKARRHIIDKIKNGVKGFASGAGTFIDQVGMAADLNQSMEEMTGGVKKLSPMELLAKGIGRGIGAVGGGAIAKRFAQKAHPMLKDLNKGLDYFKSTAFVKMANLKRNWEGSDNRVLDFLAGFIPDFKPTDRGGNDLLDKPKEPVPFDVMTRQSIVEIIPGYLSKILQSTESVREGIGAGQSEQQVFNMYSRKFTTTSELMESMHERMYGRDQDRQYFFTKAMGALQAGQIRKNPDQDPAEIYKEYEKDIHRFLVNHGVRREILDLDKISKFIGSAGQDSSAYINRIVEGFENDPVKVLKAIYDGLTDAEGKLDRHMVQDLNNAIMSYYNQDNYIAELPKVTETYGYRWAISDKVNARERDALQKRIDKYTGPIRVETMSETERQNLSDRAAAGDEEAMDALDSLAARRELDSKMGLMGDRNEINLRGIERIQAGGIKYGSEIANQIKTAREDAMRDYEESDVAAAQWQDIKDKTGISKVEEFVRERKEALKKKSKESMDSVKDMFGIDHDVDLYDGISAKVDAAINRGVDWSVQMINDPKAREEYIQRKKQDLSDTWDATKEFGKDSLTEIRKAIENPEEAYGRAKDAIQKKYDEAADAFKNSESGKAIIEKVDDLTKRGKEAYEKHTPESVKKLINDIGALAAKAPDEARSLINQVEDSLNKAYTDHVPEDARKSIAETKEAVEKAIREQAITAARVVEQLARDPKYREEVKGKVKKGVADAVDATAETLDEAITDPSRTGRKLKIVGKKTVRKAKNIGESAVAGAKSVGETIAATASSVHDSVVGSLSEENQKRVTEAEQAIKSKLSGAAETVVNAVPKSQEELVAKLTAAKDATVDFGKKAVSTVTEAFTPSEKAGPEPFDPATFGPIIRANVADGIIDAFTKYEKLSDKIANAFASVKTEPELPGGPIPGTPVPPTPPPTEGEGTDRYGASINDTLGQFFALYRDNAAAQAKLLDDWKTQVNTDHDSIFAGIGYISKTLREMPPAIASGTAMPEENGGEEGGTKTYRQLFKNTGSKIWKGAKGIGGKVFGFYKDIYSAALGGIGKIGSAALGKDGVVSRAVGGISTLANSMFNAMVKHPDYVDIYLKGHENEQPLVTKRQQEDPKQGVFFKKNNERVKRSKDINEPVVDKDGNILISEEDLKVGLVMPDGSPLNRLMGGLNKFMKGYFGVYAAALKGAGNAVGTVAKALFGTKGEPYVDIYRKDEVGKDYKPILTALKQERDPGVFFKNGKRVRNSEDINEPVYSPDGKELINQDDIDHGLVGADNKPISTKKGRAGLISKVLDIGKALAPGVGKAIGKIGELYKDIYSKLFGLGVGAVKGVGKMAGSFINRLFGFDVAGNNKKLIELVTKISEDVSLISSRYKYNPDDQDGDGDIDGTYEDQMKEKEKHKGEPTDKSPTPAGKAEADAAKAGILERLFGGGKGGKDGKDGDSGGGFFEDMLKWKAFKWFMKKLGKGKHFLKLLGGGSILKGAVKAVSGYSGRGIAAVGKAFGKGGAVRTAAGKVVGAFGKGGAVRTAASKTGTWIAEHGGKTAVEGLKSMGGKIAGKGGLLRNAKAAVMHSARGGVLSKVGGALGKAGSAVGGAFSKVGGKIAGSKLATSAGTKLAAAGGIKGAGRMAGKFLGKAAGPLAALTELGFGGYDAYKAYKAGDTKGGSKAVGGAIGGAGGALGGAALGASIGSIVPGVGTAIGGLLGGIIGSMAGGGAGKWIGGKAHDAIVEDKGILKYSPIVGLIRGIRGNDNQMSEKEIEQGRKKLARRVEKGEPGYDKILSEYEKAIEDKNWKRARQLSGKEADGLIKSLWKHSITGAVVGGTAKFIFGGLFGKKNEEMTKEEIEKVRAKYQSLMKKGGDAGKKAEKLLNKFDDYVADEDWKSARKLANMEKTGLWGKIFGDSHGKTQWGKVAGVAAGALLGGPIGALLGYGVGALFTKADKDKPMTEKEVADARARLMKLQEGGNKAAGKILEQFDEAVTEMNWKKARKLVGEDVQSNLEKLGKAAKSTVKWGVRIATLGLSTLFETDQEKPLTDQEIKKFTDKMNFLISKGDKRAEKKLEKFEEAVAAQKWEKARLIARMPDESKVTKAAKATWRWLVGDDEKPMTEQEMQKFRDSMNRKIQMGSKTAQKKLDAFEDAVGAQRWKRARVIAGTPDDGAIQKVGKGIGKAVMGTWRFLFGGDGAAMSESEINTARKRMEWACTEGKKGAQKRLDLFNDYVQDEKWEKARALAKMPYENVLSRAKKAVTGWLFGDQTHELSAEEIDKFRGECEQRIADGNKKAEKILADFNKAVDLENWEMARKISGNKDWGVVGKVGKGIKKVWDFFAGNSDYEDCMKIKEELEEKSFDDDTGMISKGLEEFMKLVRRQEYNAAMELAKDLQKLKPNEIKKKYKISTDEYEKIGKDAEELTKRLDKNIEKEKGWFPSLKKMRLKMLRTKLVSNPGDWNTEFLDNIREEMASITGEDEFENEDKPDDAVVKEGERLVKDVEHAQEKFGWLTSPIKRAKLASLKSEIQADITTWCDETIKTWKDRLKEIDDSYNRNGNSENGGGYADEDAGKEVEEEVEVVDEEVEKKRKRLSELKKKEFEGRFTGELLTDKEQAELNELKQAEADGKLEEGATKTVKQKHKIAPKLKADNGKDDYEQDAGPDSLSDAVQVKEGSPFKEEGDELLTELEKAQGKTVGGKTVENGHVLSRLEEAQKAATDARAGSTRVQNKYGATVKKWVDDQGEHTETDYDGLFQANPELRDRVAKHENRVNSWYEDEKARLDQAKQERMGMARGDKEAEAKIEEQYQKGVAELRKKRDVAIADNRMKEGDKFIAEKRDTENTSAARELALKEHGMDEATYNEKIQRWKQLHDKFGESIGGGQPLTLKEREELNEIAELRQDVESKTKSLKSDVASARDKREAAEDQEFFKTAKEDWKKNGAARQKADAAVAAAQAAPEEDEEEATSFEGKFTQGVKSVIKAVPAAGQWVREKDAQATGAILEGANKFGNAVIDATAKGAAAVGSGLVKGAKAVGAATVKGVKAYGEAASKGLVNAPTVHGGGMPTAPSPVLNLKDGSKKLQAAAEAQKKASAGAEFTKEDEPHLFELAKFGRGCGNILTSQYAVLGADDWHNGVNWLTKLTLPLNKQDQENGFVGHMNYIDGATGAWYAGLSERDPGLRQKVMDIMVEAEAAGKATGCGPYDLRDQLGHTPTWQELCDKTLGANPEKVATPNQDMLEAPEEEEVSETKSKTVTRVAGEEVVDGQPTEKQKTVDAISVAMGNKSAFEQKFAKGGFSKPKKFGIGGMFKSIGNFAGNLVSSDGMGTDRELVQILADHLDKHYDEFEKWAKTSGYGEDPFRFICEACPIDPKLLPEGFKDGDITDDTIDAFFNEVRKRHHGQKLSYLDRLEERSRVNDLNRYMDSGDSNRVKGVGDALTLAKDTAIHGLWSAFNGSTREEADAAAANREHYAGGGYLSNPVDTNASAMANGEYYAIGGFAKRKFAEGGFSKSEVEKYDNLVGDLEADKDLSPEDTYKATYYNDGLNGKPFNKPTEDDVKEVYGSSSKKDYLKLLNLAKHAYKLGQWVAKHPEVYEEEEGGSMLNPLNWFSKGGFSSEGSKFLTKPTESVDADGTPIVAGEAGTEAIIPLTKRPGNLLTKLGDKIRAFLSGNKPEGPTKFDTTSNTGDASVHASDPDSEPMTNYLAKQLSDIIGPVDQKSEFEQRFANGGFSDGTWNPFSGIANKIGMLKSAVTSAADMGIDGLKNRVVDTVSGIGSKVGSALGILDKPNTDDALSANAVDMSAPVMQSRIASANSGAAAEQVAAMTAARDTQAEKTDQLLAATNKLVMLLSSVMSKNGVKIDGMEDLADAVASTSTNNTAIQPTTIINSPDSTDSMEQEGIDMRKAQG